MATKYYNPIPVFDRLNEIIELHRLIYNADNARQSIKCCLEQCLSKAKVNVLSFEINDYRIALNFLHSYRGSSQTFGAYRLEIERVTEWS